MNRSLPESFKNALRGLRSLWQTERNFRLQVIAAVAVLFILWWFHFPYPESLALITVTVIVLALEGINTIFEKILDHLVPRDHPLIGQLKDIMAGVVLLAALAAVAVALLILFNWAK